MQDPVVMYQPARPTDTATVERDAYRNMWYAKGWRSDQDPSFSGTVVDLPIPLPAGIEDLAHQIALKKWYQKLAVAGTGGLAAQLIILADSRSEGFTSTRYRNRWIDQLRRILQGSVPGSMGFLPASAGAFSTVIDADWAGGDNPWTYSGVTGSVSYGLGFHAAQCTSGSITLTYFGDTVNLVYVRTPTGPSAAAVTLDGVSQTALNAQGAALPGQVASYGSSGAYGFHTLVVTVSTGTLVFEGAMWHEGGFNGFTLNNDVIIMDGTHAGFGMKDWAGSNNDWSGFFQSIVEYAYAGLVLYCLDINDLGAGRTAQQFEDDCVIVAQRLDARMLTSDLGHLFCFLPSSGDTTAYVNAAWRAAARIGFNRSSVIDLAQIRPSRGWGTDLSADVAHPNDAGHRWVAGELAQILCPTPRTPVPVTPQRYVIDASTPADRRVSWTYAPSSAGSELKDTTGGTAVVGERHHRRWHDAGTYRATITAEHATGRGILEVLIGRYAGATAQLVSCGTVDTSTPAGPTATTTTLATSVTTDVPGWVDIVIRKTAVANTAAFEHLVIDKTA